MQFCRHITPLYSGAWLIGRHEPVIYAVLPVYYIVVIWRRENRPLQASRESGVTYLIGEVNGRFFSCMQRVMVGVCFPTLFSPSMASLFRRMFWVFSSCAYMWLSHMRKYDASCTSGAFIRYFDACFVIT